MNTIVDALLKKISKAMTEDLEFKVCIVLPLLPGFEGEITEKTANVMRI